MWYQKEHATLRTEVARLQHLLYLAQSEKVDMRLLMGWQVTESEQIISDLRENLRRSEESAVAALAEKTDEVESMNRQLDIAVGELHDMRTTIEDMRTKIGDRTQKLAEYEASSFEVQLAQGEKHALVAELNALKLQVKLPNDEYDDMPFDINCKNEDQNQKGANYEAPLPEMQPAKQEKNAPVAQVDIAVLSLDTVVEQQKEMCSKVEDQNQKLPEYEASSVEMQLPQGEKHAVVVEVNFLKLQGTLQKDGHDAATLPYLLQTTTNCSKLVGGNLQ
ncbi:hypothetical protein DFS34DRAFT_615234 [Phlyctochytrium arcticum]|nr:hypothetical protein DFS34DRAFT_615234 [Phlyctochytrium arcticum]